MGKKRKKRPAKRTNLTGENGYLLVSSLFFLVFSGLFTHSIINISGNQLIQMNQITASYQAKTSLNMAKELLRQEVNEDSLPETGFVQTSVGDVIIAREETVNGYSYLLTLQTTSGAEYSDRLSIPGPDSEQEPIESHSHEESNGKTNN